MSDAEQPSSPTPTEALNAHLAKLPGGACPFCNGESYTPMAHAQVQLFDGAPLAQPTVTLPAVVLLCNGCGWMALLSSNAIPGFLPT